MALTTSPALVRLAVKDDGQGFDPQDVPPDHFGLHIMRERAASIGAALDIASQWSRGTRVSVLWGDSSPEEGA